MYICVNHHVSNRWLIYIQIVPNLYSFITKAGNRDIFGNHIHKLNNFLTGCTKTLNWVRTRSSLTSNSIKEWYQIFAFYLLKCKKVRSPNTGSYWYIFSFLIDSKRVCYIEWMIWYQCSVWAGHCLVPHHSTLIIVDILHVLLLIHLPSFSKRVSSFCCSTFWGCWSLNLWCLLFRSCLWGVHTFVIMNSK